jgi:hypothetical protein
MIAGYARVFKTLERWILVACVGLVAAGYALSGPLEDFVEYWAPAHQLVAGRNPYSFPESFQIERAPGWSRSLPSVNMNPPWTLPLIAPLGLAKSYVLPWIVGVNVLAVVVWWSTRLLLDLYSASDRVFPSESYASKAMLGCTFLPSLLCLKFDGNARLAQLVQRLGARMAEPTYLSFSRKFSSTYSREKFHRLTCIQHPEEATCHTRDRSAGF